MSINNNEIQPNRKKKKWLEAAKDDIRVFVTLCANQ